MDSLPRPRMQEVKALQPNMSVMVVSFNCIAQLFHEDLGGGFPIFIIAVSSVWEH